MTAKEFYEKNRGKYFYYEGEKVRVVGYDYGSVIISTKKDGWEFKSRHNVDRLLLHEGEKGVYVNIKNLNPIEPQELDLCNTLKGCEGMTLYSLAHGYVVLKSIIDRCIYPIVVTTSDGDTIDYCKDGRHLSMYKGECMLFPSKENRDWSTFKKPIKIKEGDPVMCFNGINNSWVLRKYNNATPVSYKHIVPATEFDFTDIESNKSKSII